MSPSSTSFFQENENFLQSWIEHDDSSFHDLTKEEASAIRKALLTWYRANRRKLPWRGDPPPYDGSTAVASRKRKAEKVDKKRRRTIQEFFPPTTNKQPRKSSRIRKTTSSTEVEVEEVVSLEKNEKSSSLAAGAVAASVSNIKKTSNHNVTAYGVWVSEIMLQQTRVEAVIPYYIKWMESFPTVEVLAAASEEEVNAHWAGLGFYRRARLLHQGAKQIVDLNNKNNVSNHMPTNVKDWMEISGVGRYTASAISSMAFGQPVAVVDGNVCRVLSRLRGIANHIKSPVLKDRDGWRLAQQIVGDTDSEAGEINQALMELGATYCSPHGTGVEEEDPLREFYWSTRLVKESNLRHHHKHQNHNQTGCPLCPPDYRRMALDMLQDHATETGHGPFPLPPPQKPKREEVWVVMAVAMTESSDNNNNNNNKWLMVQRPPKGLLASQWEFPAVCTWSSDRNKLSSPPTNDELEQKPTPRQKSNAVETLWRSLGISVSVSQTLQHPPPLQLQDLEEALEHVFSHVRHTLWVRYTTVSSSTTLTLTSNVTNDGRPMRWMTEEDMSTVGITSGVKKVLKRVKQEQEG